MNKSLLNIIHSRLKIFYLCNLSGEKKEEKKEAVVIQTFCQGEGKKKKINEQRKQKSATSSESYATAVTYIQAKFSTV